MIDEVHVVYSKDNLIGQRVKGVYENKEDALNEIKNKYNEILYFEKAKYFGYKKNIKKSNKFTNLPKEILEIIFKKIEDEKDLYNLKLTCKMFYYIIIFSNFNCFNFYILSKCLKQKGLEIIKNENIISVSGKTYYHKDIFLRYNGIWKSNEKEWIFNINNINILIYLENKAKKVKNNINNKFIFNYLYQYYMYYIKRFKYCNKCRCRDNFTCYLCLYACCKNIEEVYYGSYIVFKCDIHYPKDIYPEGKFFRDL